MFCPNCGNKTTEGARFCASCGFKLDTPIQQTISVPMGATTKFVPAKCTNCGGALEVDPSQEAAVCKYCNTPFIVEKAIQNYTINTSGPISVGTATINVNSINVENLLVRANDFFSKGMYQDAETYFEKVLDEDFYNNDAKDGLEKLYLRQANRAASDSKWIQALSFAQKASEVKPDSELSQMTMYKTLNSFADTLERECDYEGAIEVYLKMADLKKIRKGEELLLKTKQLKEKIDNHIYFKAVSGTILKEHLELSTKGLKVIPFKGKEKFYEIDKLRDIQSTQDTLVFSSIEKRIFCMPHSFKIGDLAVSFATYMRMLRDGGIPARKECSQQIKDTKGFLKDFKLSTK